MTAAARLPRVPRLSIGHAYDATGRVNVVERSDRREFKFYRPYVYLNCDCQDFMKANPGSGMMCMFCSRGDIIKLYDHCSTDTQP